MSVSASLIEIASFCFLFHDSATFHCASGNGSFVSMEYSGPFLTAAVPAAQCVTAKVLSNRYLPLALFHPDCCLVDYPRTSRGDALLFSDDFFTSVPHLSHQTRQMVCHTEPFGKPSLERAGNFKKYLAVGWINHLSASIMANFNQSDQRAIWCSRKQFWYTWC